MAEQRDGLRAEELTPDQCIDYAAGLLTEDEQAEVLRLAAASPESEELLRVVMAQAETARSAAAGRKTTQAAAPAASSGLVEGFRRIFDTLFGTGRLVPAMAGASLLLLGLILGAGTMQLLQPDGAETGVPARLISLFPAATRTAGPAAAVTPGAGLYVELNQIEYPCETPLLYDLEGPSGKTLLQGMLHCHPETGEWAGLFVPGQLLAEAGNYGLQLRPDSGAESPAGEPMEFRFSIR
jgi:hypothetical protein